MLNFLTLGQWRGDVGAVVIVWVIHKPQRWDFYRVWQEALFLNKWFCWGLWSGSTFPRKSTAANLGTVNYVVLKANYMAQTWLWRLLRPVLVEILNMGKKCGYTVQRSFNPQNLVKPVGGLFWRILGHTILFFCGSNKVVCGILLCKWGDDKSQLLFCF